MKLERFIEIGYGDKHGSKRLFVEDNERLVAQSLTRWFKRGYKVVIQTGELYKSASKKVNLKPVNLDLDQEFNGVTISIAKYIEVVYGSQRGCKADFLRDNPTWLPQELTRWYKTHSVLLTTGEIFKQNGVVLKVNRKHLDAHAAGKV